MTEFCHYQFYTNFALKNMHTKQSQGGEGKAQKESGGSVNSLMGKADEKKTGAGGSRKRQRKIESAE